jgi:signal transduction histidine kinase
MLAATARLAGAVASHRAAPAVHEAVLREVCDAVHGDLGALYAREGAFDLVAVRGFERDALPAAIASGEGLAGRAVSERRPVVAERPGGGHELHLPLMRAGSPIGVLTLARLGGSPFSNEDHELLDRLAPQAAVALAAASRLGGEREVDLVRVTRETTENLRPIAQERGVELELALEGVPHSIGDPEQIALAVEEVVSAAIRGTSPGGGVEVRLSTLGSTAVLEVVAQPGPGGATATFRIELPLRAAGVASPEWR